MRTSSNKKIYMFLIVILFVGIITGIIFNVLLDEASKEIIFLNINEMLQNIKNVRINNVLLHLLLLSSIFLLSVFVIGIPLSVIFVFYNGFSVGFIISSLTYIFGIKGLIYSIIYVFVSKGLFLLFLIIITSSFFKIGKIMINKLFKRNTEYNLNVCFKKVLLCIGIVLLNDIILYFVGIRLINIFNFLII